MFGVNPGNAARANEAYRRVLCTTPDFQLVVMKLAPHQRIDIEEHRDATQYIVVEEGTCVVTMISKHNKPDVHKHLKAGDAVVIWKKHLHRVDAGPNGARLSTIYSSPQHPADLVQESSED